MPKEKKEVIQKKSHVPEKLPDRLPVYPRPWCAGSYEHEMNDKAIEYNSLDPSDAKRIKVFKAYEEAQSAVNIGLAD